MALRLVLYDPVIEAYVTAQALSLVDRAARAVEMAARAEAPKRTGALAASIHTVLSPGSMSASASVGSDLDYALAVHEGTRAHIIRPDRPGGVLYFDGRFAEEVHHPATRGQPFLMTPLESVGRELGFTVRGEFTP